MLKYILQVLIISTCITLISCSKTEKITLAIQDHEMVLEAPLFEGVNTVTSILSDQINQKLNDLGIDPNRIKNARLTKAIVTLPEPEGQFSITEMVFSVAGNEMDMQRLAVKNPINSGETVISMDVAEGQKRLEQFFRDSGSTVVIDLNISNDLEEDISVKLSMEFDLEVKK